MKVSKLNDEAVTETLKAIFSTIIECDVDAQRDFLKELADKMDELAEDDFFGTEGWEHWAGLDD
jgi:hypothetical protein